jgi:hypothetical protein
MFMVESVENLKQIIRDLGFIKQTVQSKRELRRSGEILMEKIYPSVTATVQSLQTLQEEYFAWYSIHMLSLNLKKILCCCLWNSKWFFMWTGDWNLIFNSLAGGIRCIKNLTLHSASILSISAGDHWLGIGAADNSLSLFHRPQERFGGLSNAGSKVAGWQLYRTPQKTAAVVLSQFLPILFALLIKETYYLME